MRRRHLLAAGLTAPIAAQAARAKRNPLTLASFGARGDGEADDTFALVRALAEHTGDLLIGAGTYRFSRTLKVAGSNRSIRFEAGARLLGDDPSTSGLEIRGTHGVAISGISLAWRNAAQKRIRFGAGLLVMNADDVRLERVGVEGFGGAGILFESCLRPVVARAMVRHTLADGVHFANCSQALAEDIDCRDTGDDGLAFVNYRRLPEASGGTARRIAVSHSGARGITVIGHSDVHVSDFRISRTRASGIYVAQEESYATRFPRNVTFEDGHVEHAGTLDGPGGNRCGAELVRCRDTVLKSITISASRSRLVGVNGAKGTVRLSDLTLRDNEDGEGIYVRSSEHVTLAGGTVTNAFNTGLYVHNVDSLNIAGTAFSACGERGPSRTAVWIEDVRHLDARLTHVQANAGQGKPARFVLRRVAAGSVSVPHGMSAGPHAAVARSPASAHGPAVALITEDSPALAVTSP